MGVHASTSGENSHARIMRLALSTPIRPFRICGTGLHASTQVRRGSAGYNDEVAAVCRNQAVEDFMDEDELAEIRGAVAVQPTADFDTFGSAAAEAEKRRARADAAESSSQAPSLASGSIIEELLAPVAESLGEPPTGLLWASLSKPVCPLSDALSFLLLKHSRSCT